MDDLFPIGDGQTLLCSYSQQRDLWVSLLEKAYMKVMGGYDFPGSNSVSPPYAFSPFFPFRTSISML